MSADLLFEVAWKSTIVSGAVLLLTRMLKGRSAAEKAAMLRTGIAMLLILPFASATFPHLAIDVGSSETLETLAPFPLFESVPVSNYRSASSDLRDAAMKFIVPGYWAGVLFIIAQIAMGLSRLHQWTKIGRPVSREWKLALAQTKGISTARTPRLLVSAGPRSPLSWGLNPVILLDERTHACSELSRAVLAHELAHIRRRDWLTLLASRIAVAIFWFNPLVWLVERAVMHEVEEAADSCVITCVEPSDYAQVLIDYARLECGKNAVANNIASGRLSRRITAILQDDLRMTASSPRIWLAMVGLLGFAVPTYALSFHSAQNQRMHELLAPEGPIKSNTKIGGSALGVGMTSSVMREDESKRTMFASSKWGNGAKTATRISGTAGLIHSQLVASPSASADRVGKMVWLGPEGREKMLASADGMERNARQMLETAANLRNYEYRTQKITEYAREGQILTHQQLTDSIPGLEEGARGMLEGARGMREHVELELKRDST